MLIPDTMAGERAVEPDSALLEADGVRPRQRPVPGPLQEPGAERTVPLRSHGSRHHLHGAHDSSAEALQQVADEQHHIAVQNIQPV